MNPVRFRKLRLPLLAGLTLLAILGAVALLVRREPLTADQILAKRQWTAEELSDSGELQQHQFSRPLRRLKLTNGSRHIRMPPIHSQLTSGLELRRNTARFCWSTAIRVA